MMVAQYMNIALPDLLLWAHISRLSGAQCMTFVEDMQTHNRDLVGIESVLDVMLFLLGLL